MRIWFGVFGFERAKVERFREFLQAIKNGPKSINVEIDCRHQGLAEMNVNFVDKLNGMKLPFDSEAFFSVFQAYNSAIWPLQVILYLLSLLVLALLLKRQKYAGKAVFYLLALLWLVNGAGYHVLFFSDINKAALAFGAMFVAQAFLFAWHAWKSPLTIPEIKPVQWALAAVLIAYATLFYSLIGHFAGHEYPRAPVFGVAPCPTTIFTFGILLLVEHLRWYLYLIPLLWTLVGTSAAFVLGVREDFGLAAAALIFIGFWLSGCLHKRVR